MSGLDNAAPLLPLQRPSATVRGKATPRPSASAKIKQVGCSYYYGERVATGLPKQFGTTSFPTYICGYSGTQMRKAYGATAAAAGGGQTVALIELGLTQDMFLTLKDYAKKNGVPAPAASRYSELSLGQGSACGDPFYIEEQLDVEASYDMAPGANQLVVGGDSCNQGDFGLQGLFNADLAVLGTGGHPLATVASNSWGSGDEEQAAFITNIEHAILVQAAAEGVGMYFASGDGSGVYEPASDPYAISVGGTTLGIGKGGTRLFETGWSDGLDLLLSGHSWTFAGENGAGGGGPSLIWTEPAYQDSFDDQSTKMFGYTGQVTLPGYDNMTGIGTPAGPAFITSLRSTG